MKDILVKVVSMSKLYLFEVNKTGMSKDISYKVQDYSDICDKKSKNYVEIKEDLIAW